MTEYNSVFVLRNKVTDKMIFKYWASSGQHKAIFSSRKRAEKVISSSFVNKDDIEIIEIK